MWLWQVVTDHVVRAWAVTLVQRCRRVVWRSFVRWDAVVVFCAPATVWWLLFVQPHAQADASEAADCSKSRLLRLCLHGVALHYLLEAWI